MTLCEPPDCSLPGSSIHKISQARILEWVAISFSRRSYQPKDSTRVSYTAGRFFTTEPPGKPQIHIRKLKMNFALYQTIALPHATYENQFKKES